MVIKCWFSISGAADEILHPWNQSRTDKTNDLRAISSMFQGWHGLLLLFEMTVNNHLHFDSRAAGPTQWKWISLSSDAYVLLCYLNLLHFIFCLTSYIKLYRPLHKMYKLVLRCCFHDNTISLQKWFWLLRKKLHDLIQTFYSDLLSWWWR